MYRIDRHGVAICFQDVGKGAPPLVLIHELGCDHTTFEPQISHFRRNHRVVAVDMRGHGESDKPENGYSIQCLADDIAWLNYELGLYAPVVVGHGLGGMVAIDLAARYPKILSGVVALDSPILPPEIDALRQLLSKRLRAPAFRETLLDENRSLTDAGLNRLDIMLRSAYSMSEQSFVSVLESILAWDSAAAVASCRAQILYIDTSGQSADPDHFLNLRPQIVVARTEGVGHFCHLELPGKVNEMIECFMARKPNPPPFRE
ncbi:MAG: alpha/beta fold hydrolase [Chloroflexota bacterium]